MTTGTLRSAGAVTFFALLMLMGCQTVEPLDYTVFRQHRPASILVLPPINNTTEVIAGYSVYTTATRPLAELGYYVTPVVMVDQILKENGLPGPNEMHQAPLEKLREVFGVDAVLYVVVEEYGSKYRVIVSNTTVTASARLIDSATGSLLWENRLSYTHGGNAGLIEALVDQVVNKLVDQAHQVGAIANVQLLMRPNQGLLPGPRHPEFSP